MTTPELNEQQRLAAAALYAHCRELPIGYEWYRYRFPKWETESNRTTMVYRPNVAGWHARGEQIVTAASFAGIAMGRYTEETRPFKLLCELEGRRVSTDIDETTALRLATSTLQATPYLWSDAVSATIHAAPELPPHVVSRSVLPFPQMFWALETPWSMMTLTNVTVAIEFFLLLDQGTSFVLICCVDANGRESEVLSRTIAYGTRYPEEIEPESLGGIVLQHLSFLNSPYIKSDEERIERAVRRRCARVSPEEAEKTIRVVTLRRPSKPTTSTAEPGSREWKHQWWVTGHHRAQWYASEQAHRVKWIAPYLKGPSDKPVLDKVYAVKQ